MLKPRPLFIAGFLLLVSLFALAQDPEQNKLPDLGEPAANAASVQPNINADGAGFSYQDNSNGSLLSINPQYNKQNGVAVGGSLATPVGTNSAAGILLMAGEDRNEWLINAGMDLTSNHRLIFSLGQLRQKLDFNFLSGSQKTQVTQDNAAFSYQYLFGQDWLNAAELHAYLSNTDSITLSDKTYYTDTDDLYELWNDSRRIAGGRVSGAQGKLVFTPSTNTTVKLGFGAERLTYEYLTGDDTSTRATGSVELMQRLDNGFNFRASANAAASQSRYALGLGKSFNDGSQLGVDVTRIQGRDHTFNDNQIQLSYTQTFGGNTGYGNSPATSDHADALNTPNTANTANHPAPAHTAAPAATSNSWASSLVEQVSRRPSVLPAQVMAKVDSTATPTRLIAVDKTALPDGSSIDNATGILTVPIGVSVSAIASVTLNSAAFSNSGQFALSGSTHLVINPNLISQPASTDTYVVTMNNTTGGGTTLATVTVTHGSVIISSVVMSSGQLAQTITFSGLSSKLVTDASFVVSATASSGLSVSLVSNSTSVCTISSGTLTLVAPGTCSITASQDGNADYSAATSVTQTFAVTAATQATLIASASPDAIVALTGTSTLSTSGGSGAGAVTYAVTTGSCTVDGTTLTAGSSVETCTVTATKAANGAYAATTDTVDITVSPPAGYITSGGLTWAPIIAEHFSWTAAQSTCSASTALGYLDWRQPTQDELVALYNSGSLSPAPAGWSLFWTWSSTVGSISDTHQIVNLANNGTVDYAFNNFFEAVSCVH